eukprot:scaffold53858_cov51-Phaeocystis_antarctica.AAC.1
MVLRSLQIIHDAPQTTRLQSITSNASLVATQRLWAKRWHGTCEQLRHAAVRTATAGAFKASDGSRGWGHGGRTQICK